MKRNIVFTGSHQQAFISAVRPIRDLEILSVDVERPMHQLNDPSITIMLKGGNKVYTTISRLQELNTVSGNPFNVIQRVREAAAEEGITSFDAVEIRPYNFYVHPRQSISLELRFN